MYTCRSIFYQRNNVVSITQANEFKVNTHRMATFCGKDGTPVYWKLTTVAQPGTQLFTLKIKSPAYITGNESVASKEKCNSFDPSSHDDSSRPIPQVGWIKSLQIRPRSHCKIIKILMFSELDALMSRLLEKAQVCLKMHLIVS